jgi:AcrR family transcriptional regulator
MEAAMPAAANRAAVSAAKPRKERAENAAMRRRQLIAATARSIVENGLAKTTLATVSAASGLSQGVAVFYFGSKERLFAEVLRQQYEGYQCQWQAALEAAGDPVEQLAALIRADFDPAVCNADALVIWHAFWGEASARPLYAELSDRFDSERASAMCAVCARLLGGSARSAAEIGAGIDALTDGLWLRIYLSNGAMSATDGLQLALNFVATIFPEHAGRLTAATPKA